MSQTLKTKFTFVNFIIQKVEQYVLVDILHLNKVCVISKDELFKFLKLLQKGRKIQGPFHTKLPLTESAD